MEKQNLLNKTILILYRRILPIVTIFILMIASQFDSRPWFFNSLVVDIIIRLFLSIWLSVAYYKLPRLSKDYRFYSNIIWSKSDLSAFERIFYIAMGVISGILVGIVTYWLLIIFLPTIKDISFFIAIINGFIFGLPLIIQYQALKV
jgi:hypothetical protein